MKLRNPILFLMVFLLAACAQFGIATPKAFTDRVAAAQITVTGVRSAALSLAVSNSISKADAKNAQAAADAGNEAIDLALNFYVAACPVSTTPCASPSADAKLSAAIAILTATQVYLATKGAK